MGSSTDHKYPVVEGALVAQEVQKKVKSFSLKKMQQAVSAALQILAAVNTHNMTGPWI